MEDRIQRCLDGRLEPSELTPEERRELEELETVVQESLAFVRETPVPDLEPAVMDRIRELEAGREAAGESAGGRGLAEALAEAAAWLWRPRTVRLRPVWAMAAAVVLALGVGVLPSGPGGAGAPDGAELASASAEAGGSVVYVRFELEAEEASEVRVAGTFTDWQPSYELAETRPGQWTALVPLEPGVHEYAFVVDGERWVADPHAPRVDDGFGGVNSRIALVAPGRERSSGGGTSS